MPLILTHGWPGSVVEFQKVIEPLTDPAAHGGNAADAFHVVCPSLPGFGFSAKPTGAGWGVDRIAVAWATLMGRLGYHRYAAQGGDWGSAITSSLGAQDPAHCLGIHITLAMGSRPRTVDDPSPEEAHALQRAKFYQDWDAGYAKQQSTRPQTLGYGLTDSPAGQAAWILEKFQAWTDCDGHPENILGRDELLDNVMLYWVTATAASSARLYWESFGAKRRVARTINIPTGVAVFPQEIVPPVRRWMEATYTDIRHWSVLPKGGHFAAFEQPALFVDDVRAYFRTLR
jgi:pimeloyl-ACP methyl ester carboxylesterase